MRALTDIFDIRYEAVAPPRYGFHEPSVCRRISECLPDFQDCRIETPVEVNKRVGRPHLAPQFFTSDDVAGVLHQRR
jgi:hypothetical protein